MDSSLSPRAPLGRCRRGRSERNENALLPGNPDRDPEQTMNQRREIIGNQLRPTDRLRAMAACSGGAIALLTVSMALAQQPAASARSPGPPALVIGAMIDGRDQVRIGRD